MLTAFARDSKGRQRRLKVSGHIKPSGMITGRVITDRGAEYFPWIKPNGSFGCRNCPSQQHGAKCYHLKALEAAAAQGKLPTFTAIAGYDIQQAADQVVLHSILDEAYAREGRNKQVSGADNCPGCGNLKPKGSPLCGRCLI